jgi:hypothetical protein
MCLGESNRGWNLLILPAPRLGPSTCQLSGTMPSHSRFSPHTSCPICWRWTLCFPLATRFTDVANKTKTHTHTQKQTP